WRRWNRTSPRRGGRFPSPNARWWGSPACSGASSPMTTHRRHAAERRIAAVLLACLGLAGMPRATVAQPDGTGTENRAPSEPSGVPASLPVTLEITGLAAAAVSLRDFLRRHLDLPAVAAGDESGRAALSRRASRDVVAL